MLERSNSSEFVRDWLCVGGTVRERERDGKRSTVDSCQLTTSTILFFIYTATKFKLFIGSVRILI
jgi:hypothetical protein